MKNIKFTDLDYGKVRVIEGPNKFGNKRIFFVQYTDTTCIHSHEYVTLLQLGQGMSWGETLTECVYADDFDRRKFKVVLQREYK